MNKCLTDILKVISYFIDKDDANIGVEILSIGKWLDDKSMSNLRDDALTILTDLLRSKQLLVSLRRYDPIADDFITACNNVKISFEEADIIDLLNLCVRLCKLKYNNQIPNEIYEDLRNIAILITGNDNVITDLLNPQGTNSIENMYKVLEITQDASADDVKRAYRRIALICHPDRLANITEEERQWATRILQEATEAKDKILENITKTKNYE